MPSSLRNSPGNVNGLPGVICEALIESGTEPQPLSWRQRTFWAEHSEQKTLTNPRPCLLCRQQALQ